MLDSLKLVFFLRWVVEVKMGPLMQPLKNMIEKVFVSILGYLRNLYAYRL